MDGITERIERAQRGDKGERDRLVVDNMPLVWSMVGRFSSSGKDKEELFQIGMIGLMQAIDRFDTTYDVRFSTYAVPLILGEIRRFLRDDNPIKVSRTIAEHRYFCGSDRRKNGIDQRRCCPCHGKCQTGHLHL